LHRCDQDSDCGYGEVCIPGWEWIFPVITIRHLKIWI
jgi:hypothetical protein